MVRARRQCRVAASLAMAAAVFGLSSCQPRRADASSASFPTDLGAWISVAPPSSSHKAWVAANHSKYHWTVYERGAQVRARLSRPVDGPRGRGKDIRGPKPPFRIPANPDIDRGFPSDWARVVTCRVADGWLIAHYAGEWGGSMWWYSPNGKQSYRVSEDMVKSFVSTPDGLHLAEGLAHLDLSQGTIKKIVRDTKTGKWATELVARLPKAPDCAINDGRGGLLVAADDLLQVSAGGQIKTLLKGIEWGGLYPGSMVLCRDGSLYVGMRQGVAKVEAVFEAPRYSWLVPSRDLVRDAE